MTELFLASAIVTAYVALLVGVAVWAERAEARGRRVASNRTVYALSLAVYASTWTYYGSVGFAARRGLLFLTVYLGPTLCAVIWWWVLRGLVRLKSSHRVTGLPDLLALRFEKSQGVALLATAVLVIGLLPYLALQLKTLISTLGLVAGPAAGLVYPDSGRRIGPPLVAFLLLFTVLFGLRRVRPTERHPGLMVALAVESMVKLVAFVAVGAFVTWGLFHGFRDVLTRASMAAPPVMPESLGGDGVITWLAHLLLSGVAVLLLPRQFHVAVVENADEDHVRTAAWLFPAYLLAMNVFVLPIALGGLLLGHPAAEADTFVLGMPLAAGRNGLSWLVFLGGFSAGTGMVIVETIALATMISNHVVLPAAEAWRPFGALRRALLPTRWAAAALVLAAAFGYERLLGHQFSLASIGFVSFAAVLQLAPALAGGFLWKGASRAGALAGMAVGFATWGYTLVVPVLARSGWLPVSLLVDGPFGIETLVPEGLFDLHIDPVSHAVVWSLLLNGGAFVVGSLLFPPRAAEAARAERLLAAASAPAAAPRSEPAPALAPAEEKRERAAAILGQYHGARDGARLADGCLKRVGADRSGALSALQLAELEAEVETTLAAAIGSAAAHAALQREPLVTPEESSAISSTYAGILAALHVAPAELHRKIDYHRERERLLAREASTQRFLAGVSGLLGASLDLEATARTAVRLPVGRLANGALLWLARGEVGGARALFAHADPGRERAGCAAVEALGAGALAEVPSITRALRTRLPVVQRPVPPGAWPPPLVATGAAHGEVTLPLVAGSSALGTLTLFLDDEARMRPADDLGLAEELARRLAIALDNARLYRRAEEAVRARDEFLAIASHELKTPLTPLRIKIQTLERLVQRGGLASVSQEKLLQLFGGAEGQVVRLVGLVDDLLDVTRITSRRLTLRPVYMDLAGLVGEVVQRHTGELAAAGCALRMCTPPAIPGCWDRDRMDQVVTNLLLNAAKYAPGSHVEVKLDADEGWARLEVRDDGPGIAPEDQERIFRPFERATRYLQVSGFGLGLFIVRQIVEAHGGRVLLVSAPGQGAAFTVELPRSLASA